MAKYRKKILVDAEPYRPGMEDGFINGKPVIHTLEGFHVITPTDWILTGVKGERWPCKADVFAATYELAEAEETMAIQPVDFTNEEIRALCKASLIFVDKALENSDFRSKVEKVLMQADSTQDGFFIGSYAGPKFTEIKFVDPDEVD